MSNQIIVLNLTTESYYIGESVEDCARLLRELLTPLTLGESILKSDIGESHWKRGDKIVYAPPHLYTHVQKNYNRIFV
jgi:hypothetical protein